MALLLSPAKAIIVAVQCATSGEVERLTWMAAHHGTVLRSELMLRILLTYLPETLPSTAYIPLLQKINAAEYEPVEGISIDCSSVADLSDEQVAKKVKKLGLLSLPWDGAPEDSAEDPLSLFLIHRAYRVDEGARLLAQLPGLLVPFLDHSATVRSWTISILLPFVRRSIDYYRESLPVTLREFVRLDDEDAVDLLLAQTASTPESIPNIGRDLRGLIAPWLHNEARWRLRKGHKAGEDSRLCPGFERVLEWLVSQASLSWRAAVGAVEQWNGPADVDLGDYGKLWLDDDEQGYMKERYARAALAAAYTISEPSVDALKGSYTILARVIDMLGHEPITSLQMAGSMLAPAPDLFRSDIISPKNKTFMRNHLLSDENALTSPSSTSMDLLRAVILSAFLLTRAGVPCSVRMAGDLALLENKHEQEEEFHKLVRAFARTSKRDNNFWTKARNEILWLRDWGAEEVLASSNPAGSKGGVFSLLRKDYIEAEILRALLSDCRMFELHSGPKSKSTQPLTLSRILPRKVLV